MMKKNAIWISVLAACAIAYWCLKPSDRPVGDPAKSVSQPPARESAVPEAESGEGRQETPAVATNQPTVPVFSTPLIPSDGRSLSQAETEALELLKADFTRLGGQDNIAAARRIATFLEQFPQSPFAVSLLQEQAETEWRHGYFTDALATWQRAWLAGRELTGIDDKRLAEAALARLLPLMVDLGKRDELRELIATLKDRPLGGQAQEAFVRAKESLWFLEHRAEDNVFCGFSATNEICVPRGKRAIFPDVHDDEERADFVAHGLSLAELREHSQEAGGDLKMVKCPTPVQEFPVPSVFHWTFDHYSALTERSGDLYRVKDFHLKFDGWVSADALAKQTSGYFLVAADAALPTVFSAVADGEAKTVFGRHCTHARSPSGGDGGEEGGGGGDGGDPDGECGGGGDASSGAPVGNGESTPMAQYRLSLLNPGLVIFDTPIAYSPPYGPPVKFRLEYDQRSVKIPDLAVSGNFGPRWTYNYAGSIEMISTGTPWTSLNVVFGDGEFYPYTYGSGKYSSTAEDQPRLDYLDAAAGGPGYRLRFSDGQIWLYTKPNAVTPTRYLLSERRDPFGNALKLEYDANLRLVSLTDALDQKTLISYTPEAGDGVPADATKIRSITDPFGRKASFRYTAAGQLQKIIDPVGIESVFGYSAATPDFIERLTTPVGTTTATTTFTWEELPGINSEPGRAIEATDPYGDKERVEHNDYSNYPQSGADPNPAPTSVTVAGQAVTFYPKTTNLSFRNTFYWDKLRMKYYPRDYSKATIYNWKAENNTITGITASIARPGEGRVWFNHPAQTNPEALGKSRSPSKIVRLVEGPDGTPTWTMEQREYDSNYGKLKKSIDPQGRETVYEYNDSGTVSGAVAGLDLTAVKVKRGATYDVVARFSDFVGHQPRLITDAAGQTTRLTYNATGQVTSIQNAKGETTTYNYFAADALPKRRKGQLSSIDGPLAGTGDSVFFDYDAAGRVATVTGPDNYTLAFAYDNIDRLTRVTFPDTTYTENTYQHLDLKTSRDRLGRLTQYAYNNLRQLAAVTDPANRTVRYQWCKCGDLRQLIDAMGRVTTWQHDAGGRVTAKKYVDGSTVTYAYQPFSGRLASVTDEKGQIKNFSYNADGSLARLSYPNPQRPTADVAFTYDPAYPRLATMTDGIGTTSYGYHPVTGAAALGAGQLATIDGPWANDTIGYAYDQLGRATNRTINGAVNTQTISYLANRVNTITNLLGTFTYGYDGNTSRLASVSHGGGVKTKFSYFDGTQDRLLRKIEHLKPDGVTPLSVFDYTYDAHGRIATWKQQVDNAAATAKTWTIGYDGADPMKEGADQLSSVKVHQGATLIDNQAWTYDPAGNRTSETVNGAATSFTYNSLNELIQTSGTQTAATYEWDAENRLTAIVQGTARTEFTYDGLGRRVKVVEKTNGTVTSTQTFLWCGLEICERRDATGATVQQRYFPQGFQGVSGTPTGNHLYTRDHLGSIREIVDSSGTLKERISYSPWGVPTFSNATPLSSFAFTGHFWHGRSGLHLAPYRAYMGGMARWLERDPIEEDGGINLYGYVENSPIGRRDPLGLDWTDDAVDWFGGRGPDNFMLGIFDSFTLNLASDAMQYFGMGGMYNKCSLNYQVGQITGFVAGIFLGGKSLIDNAHKIKYLKRSPINGQYYFSSGSGMRPGAVSGKKIKWWWGAGALGLVSVNTKPIAAINSLFSSSDDCGCR
jgi:RHS repeat-associated protein